MKILDTFNFVQNLTNKLQIKWRNIKKLHELHRREYKDVIMRLEELPFYRKIF